MDIIPPFYIQTPDVFLRQRGIWIKFEPAAVMISQRGATPQEFVYIRDYGVLFTERRFVTDPDDLAWYNTCLYALIAAESNMYRYPTLREKYDAYVRAYLATPQINSWYSRRPQEMRAFIDYIRNLRGILDDEAFLRYNPSAANNARAATLMLQN